MVLNSIKFIFILIEAILLFNLLIVVHELGHFLAAKWRGLVVEKFAIWFGKPIWKKTIGGIEYRLGTIPAGGFVSIPQLAPMEAIEGRSDNSRTQLPLASPVDKIIVAAAGPAFSLGLAFAMACIVWGVGKPQSEFDVPVIGYIQAGGPAEKSGLHVGDRILSVDGHNVLFFQSGTDSVRWRIVRSEGATIPFKVLRDGKELTINCGWTKPASVGLRRPSLREVQVGPRLAPGIGMVAAGSPAAKAGFQTGDLITKANGAPVVGLTELVDIVETNQGKAIPMSVMRAGVPVAVTFPTVSKDGSKKVTLTNVGIEWGRMNLVYQNPFTQIVDAATSIFRMLDAVFSVKSDVKPAHFSGPVGMMRIYCQIFESEAGWRMALAMSVLINVNLALVNLLPLPVLDGGHILLAVIEKIRRKPINVRLIEFIQTACAVFLIGFMLYVTFYDVGDIVRSNMSISEKSK